MFSTLQTLEHKENKNKDTRAANFSASGLKQYNSKEPLNHEAVFSKLLFQLQSSSPQASSGKKGPVSTLSKYYMHLILPRGAQ